MKTASTASPALREAAIRELYLAAPRGPLRVHVDDALAPWIEAGDTVRLERLGASALGAGDIAGVKGPEDTVRLLRYIGVENGAVLGVVRRSLLRVKPEMVVGRAVAVERAGQTRPLVAAAHSTVARARLGAEVALGRLKETGDRLALKAYLTRLYWGVTEAFMTGVPETGDILVTDRCPVGCRFCLYSCVPEGSDMPTATITAVAQAYRDARVPKVRILGGEPFISLEMALNSFRAVASVYPADDIQVVTSGHWGGTDYLTASRLDPVAQAGLKHLLLSFDTFHIERFPVDNYERILKRAASLGLEAVLSIHYSTPLMAYLPKILELRRNYPFALRLLTVSKDGLAELLSDAELDVSGVADFQRTLLNEPGVELVMEDSTCFRWTTFPSGDLYFCCKQDEKNRVGNLGRESLDDLRAGLTHRVATNRLRVLNFAVRYDGELSWNPCLSCPLKAD